MLSGKVPPCSGLSGHYPVRLNEPALSGVIDVFGCSGCENPFYPGIPWFEYAHISGYRVHDVPFSMMGVMYQIPYESGDLVNYGGGIYHPDSPMMSGRMAMSCDASGWSKIEGYRHRAEIWKRSTEDSIFYRS